MNFFFFFSRGKWACPSTHNKGNFTWLRKSLCPKGSVETIEFHSCPCYKWIAINTSPRSYRWCHQPFPSQPQLASNFLLFCLPGGRKDGQTDESLTFFQSDAEKSVILWCVKCENNSPYFHHCEQQIRHIEAAGLIFIGSVWIFKKSLLHFTPLNKHK